MTTIDPVRRALDLLDLAVLMRMDPDPAAAIYVDTTTVEPDVVNLEVYAEARRLLEQAALHLGSLGWHLPCSAAPSDCPAPHAFFEHFQSALDWVSIATHDKCDVRTMEQLDRLLDSEAFGLIHHALADLVRFDASATCRMRAYQKP